MTSRRFHHGNLRAALIDLATMDLVAGSAETLSLRDLSARLGVSRAAPYRHFPTKEDLLRAVAEAGLRRITEEYLAAESMEARPAERLRIACRAYLALAADNPGLFNLLFFTHAYADGQRKDGGSPGSAFSIFERLVAANLDARDEIEVRPKALAAWSLLHGFAVLRMQGRISTFASEEQVMETVVNIACMPL
ncbi:putative TetR family transcriptional regulator [Novosphingobium sp. KN65.2]|nr:putative TetR family transcriptional regulator [Novosphingobium sp. KN65.2]